jgi:hypothetical protein
MGCPACAAGGIVGGWVGGYFGINPPETRTGRVLSGLLTSTLTLVTLLAAKVFFNKTLCGGASQPTINRFCRLVVAGLLLGVIYSLGVNFLLKRVIAAEFSSQRGSCGSAENCRCNAASQQNG